MSTTYRGRRIHHASEMARLEAHWDGVDDFTIERARQGVNSSCVDCFQTPLYGGLRCLPCYQNVATPIRKTESVTGFRHGIENGAKIHRKRGERPCDACAAAERTASLARKRRQRSAA